MACEEYAQYRQRVCSLRTASPTNFPTFHSHHEPRDVLQKNYRGSPLAAQLDEVRRLQGRLREQHAVVRHDAHALPVQVAKAADNGRPVALLELVETAAVEQTGDHLQREHSAHRQTQSRSFSLGFQNVWKKTDLLEIISSLTWPTRQTLIGIENVKCVRPRCWRRTNTYYSAVGAYSISQPASLSARGMRVLLAYFLKGLEMLATGWWWDSIGQLSSGRSSLLPGVPYSTAAAVLRLAFRTSKGFFGSAGIMLPISRGSKSGSSHAFWCCCCGKVGAGWSSVPAATPLAAPAWPRLRFATMLRVMEMACSSSSAKWSATPDSLK